ncbi:glycosyltransferase family 87 protein [Plantactinospora siamensis]|uniref:Glycosyltransferase family 87 protein n=1 Tax=Plantactinospora siamensis TaxID=555372 RepID=A0ABV6NVM7_9ACTN
MPAEPVAPPNRPRAGSGGPHTRKAQTRGILVIVVLVLAAALSYKKATQHSFFDLKIYLSALRWWDAGNPLYDYMQPDFLQGWLYFTYPPLTALLLRPFAAIPGPHALGITAGIFTLLTAAAVVVTTWWLVIPIADRRGWPRWMAMGIAVPLAFAVESTRETITFGQINMLLVVLVLADLLIALPRGSRWTGVGIGLATALKLYPGIFIVYLLATRRWRAAATAAGTAAAVTLLVAVFTPGESWRFWTRELWNTGRTGSRPDQPGNQSLYGLLCRLTVPGRPERWLWLALVLAVVVFGLWRAARAALAGDELAGLTLTGLVGAVANQITWPHHIYWFIPAVLVLVDAGLRQPGDPPAGPQDPPAGPAAAGSRRRRWWLIIAIIAYAGSVYGVVSFHKWGTALVRTADPGSFLLRNLCVLLALALLVALPIRRALPAATRRTAATGSTADTSATGSTADTSATGGTADTSATGGTPGRSGMLGPRDSDTADVEDGAVLRTDRPR